MEDNWVDYKDQRPQNTDKATELHTVFTADRKNDFMSLRHLPHKFLPTKAINQYVSLTQQKLSPLLVVTLLQQSASAASPRTHT